MGRSLIWREVDFPALSTALASDQTHFWPPADRPGWARELPHLKGAWLSYIGGPLHDSTATLSTGVSQAKLDTERIDPKNPGLLKYDRYYYVQMDDGRVFQLGPVKDVEYGHHLNARPNWTRSYSSGPWSP